MQNIAHLLINRLPAARPRPIGLLIAALLAAIATWLVEEDTRDSRMAAMRLEVTALASRVENAPEVTLALGAVTTMAALDQSFRQALLGEIPPETPSVNALMRDIAFDTGASTVFLSDRRGSIVAFYDRGGATTFPGLTSAGRPYFEGAMQGRVTFYPASGRATSGRGIYVSAPVRPEGQPTGTPIGVASIKVDFARIQLLLDQAKGSYALMAPEKMVFATNTPAWQYAVIGTTVEREQVRTNIRTPDRDPQRALLLAPIDDGFRTPDGRDMVTAEAAIGWRDPTGPWTLLGVSDPDAWFGLRERATIAAVSFLAALALILAVQVRNARQRERLLAREQHQHDAFMRSILDASAVAFQCGPAGGGVSVSNAAFRALFGWSDAQFTGLTERDLFAHAADYDRLMRTLEADEAVVNFEYEARRADGSTFWALKTATLLEQDGKRMACGWTVDITDRKALESQLDAARAVAEGATRAKSEFLANMSHEIRTPMNGVMSMAEMLDLTELSGDQRQMSKIIRDSARALLTIVNDILDFSKIEAGKLAIETTEFDLGDLVDGVGELLAPRANEKGVELLLQVDPALVERRSGDPMRLRQILLNLAGNALKFTEKGSVTIRALSGQDGRLRFEVEDTGIGLTEEQQARLFEPFVQADNSTARKFGGTGLGLSICKRLCELMKGVIGVTSAVGKGSVFWFELSLPPLAPAPAGPRHAIGEARVLLLGMPASQAEIATLYLSAGGVTATDVAPDFATARGLTAHRPYDLVIVDARCPDHPGLKVPASLKGPGTYALLAPRTLVSTLNAADRASFAMTLTYPLGRAALWHAAAAALGLAEPASAVADFREDLAYVPPSDEAARAANAVVLIAEDNRTNQIVVRRLLDRMGLVCDIVDDGQQALDAYERQRDRYGILLTDFHMPVMNGFELTGHVRARETIEGGARLPIIALTADALTGVAQQCIDAGMDEYLTKPIDSRKLADLLERYLPQALPLRRRRGRESPQESRPPEPVAPQIVDTHPLTEALGTFDDAAVEMFRDFLAEAETWRGEIEQSLAADDLARCRKLAHTLKGGARSIGAVLLGDVGSALQDSCDNGDSRGAQGNARRIGPALRDTSSALGRFSTTTLRVIEPLEQTRKAS